MNMLLELALAPALICAVYIFIRDKYEKEPVRLLLIGILFGAYSTAWILCLDAVLEMDLSGTQFADFYTAFITSAGVEESVKYCLLFFLVWRNKNFNEPFDGIVYAVFISLGFAGVENVIYVMNPLLGGVQTAFSRAIFSVPGHAFFGVSMGYRFALARFERQWKTRHLILAWAVPWLMHSLYNSILLMKLQNYLILLLPFVIFMWKNGFCKMKKHLKSSPFK